MSPITRNAGVRYRIAVLVSRAIRGRRARGAGTGAATALIRLSSLRMTIGGSGAPGVRDQSAGGPGVDPPTVLGDSLKAVGRVHRRARVGDGLGGILPRLEHELPRVREVGPEVVELLDLRPREP